MKTEVIEPEAAQPPAAAEPDEGDLFLIGEFAKRHNLPPTKVIGILNATAFKVDKQGTAPTKEQTIALIVVCNTYNLNPFTKEIYAFPDSKKNAVIPVVSVDGWIRIINERPELDGFEFTYSDDVYLNEGLTDLTHEAHEWIECTIYRKDRTKPTVVREYLEECYKPKSANGGYAGPWQSHTNRFLRHKALIQCARYAFGFAGIYDADEAQNILRASVDDDPAMDAILPGSLSLVEMPTRKEQPLQDGDRIVVDAASATITHTRADGAVVSHQPIKIDREDAKDRKEHIDPETGGITPMDEPALFPAAATETFETGLDDPNGSPPPAPAAVVESTPPPKVETPAETVKAPAVTQQRLDYLRMRMEFNGVSEDELDREFAGGIAGIKTMTELATVGNWIETKAKK